MGLRMDEVRLVARQDFVDFMRDRAAVKRLIRVPLLVFGIALAVGLVSYFSSGGNAENLRSGLRGIGPGRITASVPMEPDRDLMTKVALEGVPADHPLAAALEARGLDVVTRRDAITAVDSGKADAALVVASAEHAADIPTTADLSVRDEGDGRLHAERVAAALDRYALTDAKRKLEASGLDPGLVAPLEVRVAERTLTTPATTRGSPLASIGLFLMFPLIALINVASGRISGARDSRVIEPLLVLPLDRTSVLAGKGVSALGIGVLGTVGPIVPLLLLAAIPAIAAGATSILAHAVGALAVGLAAVCLVTVSFGLFSGARSRSSGANALGNRAIFFALPLLVLAANAIGQFPWAIPRLLPVPMLGTMLLLQDAVTSGFNPAHATLVFVPCLLLAGVLVTFGARALDRDVVILRSIN